MTEERDGKESVGIIIGVIGHTGDMYWRDSPLGNRRSGGIRTGHIPVLQANYYNDIRIYPQKMTSVLLGMYLIACYRLLSNSVKRAERIGNLDYFCTTGHQRVRNQKETGHREKAVTGTFVL